MAGRVSYYGGIVKDRLVLDLDAGKQASYVSGSTTWNDISYTNNNSTLVNGPAYSSENGGTILFDGSDDFATINSATTINSTTEFTFSIWVKSSIIATEQMLFQCANATLSGWNFEIYQSKFLLQCYPGGGFTQATTIMSSNVWYNLVGTYANGSQVFYNNGVQNGTASRTFTPSSAQIVIGKWINSPLPLTGNIGQILFYNKVLSAAEVLQNYNATKSRFGY